MSDTQSNEDNDKSLSGIGCYCGRMWLNHAEVPPHTHEDKPPKFKETVELAAKIRAYDEARELEHDSPTQSDKAELEQILMDCYHAGSMSRGGKTIHSGTVETYYAALTARENRIRLEAKVSENKYWKARYNEHSDEDTAFFDERIAQLTQGTAKKKED